MKVIPNVEELSKAINLSVEGGRTDAEVYDALPDAPLPDDVAAAVEWVQGLIDERRSSVVATLLHEDADHCDTILRALAASVAAEQRLREAAAALLGGLADLKLLQLQHDWIDADRKRLTAALADTPATGLLVVDDERLRKLEAMRERAEKREQLEVDKRWKRWWAAQVPGHLPR